MTSRAFAVRIYIVALTLRLIPVFLAHGLGIGLDDMFQYDMLARSLVSGNGYRWYALADLDQLAAYVDFDLDSVTEYDPARGVPTSFRAPLYPAFLAIVYFFSGTGAARFFAARLAQAVILGAPLAPLTYFVSRKLFSSQNGSDMASERAARISGWVVACYPMLLVYPLGLGTENPFFLLLLLSFLFLLFSLESASVLNLLFAGVLLGLTSLTRSVIVPFAGIAFLCLFYAVRWRSFIFLISFILIIAPWIVRNSLLHGRLTSIETSLGYNLYLGYHPQGNGSFVFGPSLDLVPILDDDIRNQIGTQEALEFIQAKPERIIPLAVNRLGFFFGQEKRVLMYFYSNNLLGYIPPPLLLAISAILLLPFIFISMSAALSIPGLRSTRQMVLLVSLFLVYLLPHILILSEDRFHLALIPFIAMLAAQFWTTGIRSFPARWRESWTGKLAAGVSILIVFLLLLNWGMEIWRDADKIAVLLRPNGNVAHFPY